MSGKNIILLQTIVTECTYRCSCCHSGNHLWRPHECSVGPMLAEIPNFGVVSTPHKNDSSNEIDRDVYVEKERMGLSWEEIPG